MQDVNPKKEILRIDSNITTIYDAQKQIMDTKVPTYAQAELAKVNIDTTNKFKLPQHDTIQQVIFLEDCMRQDLVALEGEISLLKGGSAVGRPPVGCTSLAPPSKISTMPISGTSYSTPGMTISDPAFEE